MSSTSAPQRGPYFLHIEGLPKRYTWQDLKDLVRRQANHGIWTEMSLWPNGQPGGKGFARVQRQDEAFKLYRWLTENVVENRSLRVHLWDISNDPAMFVQCNCGNNPQSHPPNAQIAQMAMRPGWQTFTANPSPVSLPPAPMQMQQPPPPPQFAQSPQQQLLAAMASLNLNPENPVHYARFQQMYYARAQAAQMQQQQQAAMQRPMYTTNSTGAPINMTNGVVRVEARGIFVSGLDFKARTKDVEAYFSKAGPIIKCEVQKDPQTHKSKGNATIKYATAEAAQNAIRMFNKTNFMKMTLNVRLDRDQTPITSPPAAGTSGQPSARSSNEPTIVNGSAQAAAAASAIRKDSVISTC